jgi:hypothetical protein
VQIWINGILYEVLITFQADDVGGGSFLAECKKTGDSATSTTSELAVRGLATAILTRLQGFPRNVVRTKPPGAIPVR